MLTAIVSGPALGCCVVGVRVLLLRRQPVFTGLIADYSPAGAVGRSYGVSFFAGFGLGSLGGVIAGAMVDTLGHAGGVPRVDGVHGDGRWAELTLWSLAERRHRANALSRRCESAT